MAQIHCNFFSYSLRYPVDIELILPSFTSCNMGDPHSHALPDRFPVLYLLHGYGNDYQAWLRYTSIQRYAEEHRIAVVTFSCHNKAYQNAPYGENFYDFLNQELPEFVENYFPISSKSSQRYIAGLSMGGYGALLHGLQNPARYCAIGAFSPGIPDPGAPLDPHRVMREDLFQLTEDALRHAIRRFHNHRGVKTASIHKYRHTFAKKYLMDCGGNAFTLQKLMGHSTLNMTKHYCRLFDNDVGKDYDLHSPLAHMQKTKARISK
jgi:pimeloyl-ACP methyl ester carboxylesterase